MNKFIFPKDATPLEDESGLKLPWVKNLKDLNRAEAENILTAQSEFLGKLIKSPSLWFCPSFLKKVHYKMFHQVWSWAGQWRTSITNIGVKPYLIPAAVSELSLEVATWEENPFSLTPQERSAKIHHQLVSIHPFENGNGRFSRLIADRYLLFYKEPHPVWPTEININSLMRKKYIDCLKAADRGDYDQLITFMARLQVDL